MEIFFTSGMPWKIFNFVVFAGLLFFFLRKPLKEFWQARSHGIRFEIGEAGELAQEARVRHEALRKRMTKIEREMEELVRSLEAEGELERRKMIEEGERLSERIRSEGEKILRQEVQRGREGLKAQAVQLSMDLAERLVTENLAASDQKRIAEEYMTGLERGAA